MHRSPFLLLAVAAATALAGPAATQCGNFANDLPYRGEAVEAADQDFSYQVLNLYLPTNPAAPKPYPVYVEVSPLKEGQRKNQTQWFGPTFANFSPFATKARNAGFAVVMAKVGEARATPGSACATMQTLPGNGTFVPAAIDLDVYRDLTRPTAERDVVMLVQNIKHRIADPVNDPCWQDLAADEIVLSGFSIGAIVQSWTALGPDRGQQTFPHALPGQQDARPTGVAAFVSRGGLLYLPVMQSGSAGSHWPDASFTGCQPGQTPMYPPGPYDDPAATMGDVDPALQLEASSLHYGQGVGAPAFLYYTVANASTDFTIMPQGTESDPHSAWSGIARKASSPYDSKLVIGGNVVESDTKGWYDERVSGNAQAADRMVTWLQELFGAGVEVINLGGGIAFQPGTPYYLVDRPHIWGVYDATHTNVTLTFTETPSNLTAHVQVDDVDSGVTASTGNGSGTIVITTPGPGKKVRLRLEDASQATVGYTNRLELQF